MGFADKAVCKNARATSFLKSRGTSKLFSRVKEKPFFFSHGRPKVTS